MESLDDINKDNLPVSTRSGRGLKPGSLNGVVSRLKKYATDDEYLETFRESLLRIADNQIATYSPQELAHHFVDYIEWNQENPLTKSQLIQKTSDIVEVPVGRPLTISAFCLFLGISTSTYHKYKEKPTHQEIMRIIDDAIYTHKFEGAAVNLFNTQIIMRDLGLNENVTHHMDDRRKAVAELFPDIEDAEIIPETTPEEIAAINAQNDSVKPS